MTFAFIKYFLKFQKGPFLYKIDNIRSLKLNRISYPMIFNIFQTIFWLETQRYSMKDIEPYPYQQIVDTNIQRI